MSPQQTLGDLPDVRQNGKGEVAGLGACPLVLGECVQGWLPEHGHFLITSPVDVFSRAQFVPDPSLGDVVVYPEERTKSRTAVLRYLALAGLPAGGTLRIFNPMEPGLGFGTSSADITASIRAAACAWGETVSPEVISAIAVAIEPTDGSMYPGSIVFEYRQGRVLECLGQLPPFYALAVRVDDGVNTVAYDEYRKDFRYSEHDQQLLSSAWQMVREAVRDQDLVRLAQATTISAEINEQLLPKQYFRQLSELARRLGVAGLMTSHSGGILGLLFDPEEPDFRVKVERVIRFVDDAGMYWFEISSGRGQAPEATGNLRGNGKPVPEELEVDGLDRRFRTAPQSDSLNAEPAAWRYAPSEGR